MKLETYLFRKHQLVGLSPTVDVNLLDVMVRVKGGGILGGILDDTHIANLGCFLGYRRRPTSSNAEDDPVAQAFVEASDEVTKGLQKLQEKKYDELPTHGMFEVRPDYISHEEVISTNKGLALDFLGNISVGCNTSAEMLCTMRNLSSHKVRDEAIDALFVGKEPVQGDEAWPPLWQPDVPKISRRCHPKGGADGKALEIWIVREKVNCEEITFKDVKQISANASVLVDGASTAVKARANRRADVKRHTLGPHTLGFRAVRLFYEHGDLKKWRNDHGSNVPKLRNHDVESCHDRDPDYHMGAFFHGEPSPTHSTGPDELELVDIKTLAVES